MTDIKQAKADAREIERALQEMVKEKMDTFSAKYPDIKLSITVQKAPMQTRNENQHYCSVYLSISS